MRTMLLALAVMLPVSSPAATFYVSPAGSDVSDGSSAAPWRTLQYAADTIASGDTVIVLPGTYAGFNVSKSGRPEQRTVFSGRPGVRIDAAAAPLLGDHRARINLYAVSHVIIEGFEVIGSNDPNTSRDGIRIVSLIENRSRDIVIRRNHVHHNSVTGLVLEDNVVGSAFTEDGILLLDSADNHVIRGNAVHSNRGSGIKLHGQRYPGGDGIVSNALIENNRVYSNGASGGAGIHLDGVRGSVIQTIYCTTIMQPASACSMWTAPWGQAKTWSRTIPSSMRRTRAGRSPFRASQRATRCSKHPLQSEARPGIDRDRYGEPDEFRGRSQPAGESVRDRQLHGHRTVACRDPRRRELRDAYPGSVEGFVR